MLQPLLVPAQPGLSVPHSCLPHMTPLWGSYHWDALTGLSTANYSTATVNTVIPLTHTQLIHVSLYSHYYNGISIFYIHMPENIYCFGRDIKCCKEILFFFIFGMHFNILIYMKIVAMRFLSHRTSMISLHFYCSLYLTCGRFTDMNCSILVYGRSVTISKISWYNVVPCEITEQKMCWAKVDL